MTHVLKIEPAIDTGIRHKIQDLLKKEGYAIHGGGTMLMEPTFSDITFSKSDDSDREIKEDMGSVSDGYHTFDELYEFRKLYNAAFFNGLAKEGKYHIHKSIRHCEGDKCFGGGWFIVVAVLPTGMISNHYKLADWDLFQVPEVEKSTIPYDGHTAKDVVDRLTAFIKGQY